MSKRTVRREVHHNFTNGNHAAAVIPVANLTPGKRNHENRQTHESDDNYSGGDSADQEEVRPERSEQKRTEGCGKCHHKGKTENKNTLYSGTHTFTRSLRFASERPWVR